MRVLELPLADHSAPPSSVTEWIASGVHLAPSNTVVAPTALLAVALTVNGQALGPADPARTRSMEWVITPAPLLLAPESS